MLTNVYVDGFNLYYGCLRGTPYKWLDLDALAHRLVRRGSVHRIRYFTAMVTARPDDPGAHKRQDTYERTLRTVSLVHFVACEPPDRLQDAHGKIKRPDR